MCVYPCIGIYSLIYLKANYVEQIRQNLCFVKNYVHVKGHSIGINSFHNNTMDLNTLIQVRDNTLSVWLCLFYA